VNCPSCGFANAAAARFCGGCGKPLDAASGAASTGERRQLTVLMCDVVGSTALSQSLDPEDLRDLLTGYQRVCSEAVKRHDGHIAQYLGDGVLIYFGFPHAHEDDARRAVRCGLDILSGMEELNRGATGATDVRLQVRVGAHTGRVVVGAVGTGARQENLAQGDTPNIAARVQSMAEPDSLVVSDATWRIVRGYFRGESQGEPELKGVAQPMRLWRVTGTSGAESRLEGGGTLTTYVGRERELEVLGAQWAGIQSGVARFVTLRGEAGIGKSRLVEEFRRHVTSPDVDLLDMRCTPYSQNSAFLPVTDLIGRRLGLDRSLSADDRLDRIEKRLTELGITTSDAAPLLAELLSIPTGERYPPLEISPIRRRARTLEILVTALQALASQRPTILVAEDLHWADPSTLELLQLLVSSAPLLPLLGLFTARPEFEPPWPTGDGVTVVDLSRLGSTEVEAMVHSVSLGKTMPGEVVRQIVQRCDGVPLFVEEIARAVLEAGTLQEREGSWELTGPLPKGLIPASVDASLMARIDRLGDARATAQLAATIGREFPYSLIKAVSERDEETLGRDLQQIIDAGLVWTSWSGGRDLYVFKHALVRDAAYESLLRRTRQQYHERLAGVLQERFPEVAAEQPELIAHHLTGAGKDEQAIGFWEAAGQRALARTAMHEAAAHLQHAIESVLRLPEEPRWLDRELDLQNGIAPVLMTVHGWGATHVRHACERARDLATRLGRFDKIYPAAWGLWTYYFLRGEMDEAAVTAKSALEMAEASGVPMIQITGRHATAYTHLYRGEFEEAVREADAGLAFFDLEQERTLAATFQFSSSVALRTARATALWMLGQVEESERERERMIRLARELGHTPSLASALAFQLHTGLCRGWHALEVDEQISVADELRALCKDEGFFLWHAVALTYRGAAVAVQGAAAQASALMQQGLAEFVQTGARLTLVPMNIMCAQARALLGEDGEAWRHLEAAQVEADARGERMWEPEIDRVRAGLLVRRGDSAGAEISLRRALAKARGQHAGSLELRAALDLHDLLIASGRVDEARVLIEGTRNTFDAAPCRLEPAHAHTGFGLAASSGGSNPGDRNVH